MKRNFSPTIFIILAYFFLTIALTWPALHLTDGIPGDGFDGWQNYWNLWWVKQALLILGTNPYFTDYLYPPTGVSLLFHTLNIFNALWTLPLQLNFGLAIAYNSVVFFSFTMAGYGGYLLALDSLTRLNLPLKQGRRLTAFVGGLVFTMSPFHMAHLLGHMQVFSMIWPPFYVLWLLRTLEPWPSRDPVQVSSRHWRNIALTCLFLILATLVDWYHTLYLLIFTGLALIWTIGQRWLAHRHRTFESRAGQDRPIYTLLQPLWTVLAIFLGFVVLLWPLLGPMLRAARSRPDLETGLGQNTTLSADLLAFFIPSEMHPWWGEWAKNLADNFSSTTSERLIFAGFVPLALAIFAVSRGWSKSVVRFWSLVILFFFMMALGPYLHVGGKIVTIGTWAIPMPYLLLYYTVPFIGLTRSLSRYDLMVMLSLGVLVAIGLVQLQIWLWLARKRSRSAASPFDFYLPYLISIAAVFLICFEFLATPYPVSKIDTPAFFYDIAADSEDYTIAELPMNWDRPTPLLHQTVHGKRLLTAYTSRNNPLELAWRTPVLQEWRYLGPDIIDQPLADIAPTIFYDFNLRYIVLDYWQMPPGPERAATEQWVAAALPGATPIYADDRLKVYQTPPMEAARPYLTLGSGWSERQVSDSGQIRRTFGPGQAAQAELFLHHPPQSALTLEITAAAETDQSVSVYANDRLISTFTLTPEFTLHAISLPWPADDPVKLTLIPARPAEPISVSRLGLSSPD